MPKKIDTDQYLTQAFKSPYTGELYSTSNKAVFVKHLNKERKLKEEREHARNAQTRRIEAWTNLRNAATCVEDIPALLQALPDEINEHYRKTAFFRPPADFRFNLTINTVSPHVHHVSITHESPLKDNTNWGGRDKEKAVSMLGITGSANENLNYGFSEAKRESGLSVCNSQFTLFAMDWPFVAKMALKAAFAGRLPVPSDTHNPNSKRHFEDLNVFSNTHTGMSYSELCGLRDTLGLNESDLDRMMSEHALGQARPSLEQLELPDAIGDDIMAPPN